MTAPLIYPPVAAGRAALPALIGRSATAAPAPGHWLAGPLLACRSLYLQVALAAVLINLFGLATSLFSMIVYNRVVPNNATDSLIALTIGVAVVVAFDFVLRTLRGYFVDVAGARIDRAVGARVFDAMLAMRLEDREGSGGAFAGLIREVEALRDMFASATVTALVDVPFILLFAAVIWALGGWLVMVPLVVVPAVILVGLATQPLVARLAAQGLHQGLSKQGVLVEAIGALETIKSCAAGPLLARRWAASVDGHAASSLRQRLIAAVAVNVAASAGTIAYLATVCLGVWLIGAQALTMGALVACSILVGRCVAPLATIAALLTRLSHTRSAYRQLDRLMRRGGESAGAALRRPVLGGAIEFRNVTFKYPGATARALDDVSFSIAAGERVAVIGRVGSGKSTIGRLILGLWHAQDGAVLIDGSDIRQLDPRDLRANVASVLQDVVLLTGTVAENIGLGEADDAAVLRAATLSGTHDFIGQLANGYDLNLFDRGEGLSGGQRQSIALARALARPRPILLLDEPTSAMDIESENALIARLDGELAGRTVVLVTHRQSMLRLVDRVIILDRGRVVAAGPRDDVLQSVATA